MSSWHTYPSIFNFGHRAIESLLRGPVLVEEKVDGSQFSFGRFDCHVEGDDPALVDFELKVRSKGAVMVVDAPEKMFTKAVEAVKAVQHLLTPNWTYRAEYLVKPKHNALAYERVPVNNLIIFDINTGDEAFLPYAEKKAEAERLGFECVPLLFEGVIDTIDAFRTFLDRTSVLGGQQIEGVVVKPVNYDLYGRDKKCLLGKFVSENFKEVHKLAWKAENPTNADVLALLGAAFGTQARWNKAILHLRERGLIEDDVKDIGKLMKEIPEDIRKECEEEIKQKLFDWAWPHVRRQVTRGVPEYYKEQLLKRQFEQAPAEEVLV